MAEALLRNLVQETGQAHEVRSAGVSTVDGLPVSEYAVAALREMEIEHCGASRAINAETVAWADLILTMTAGHKRSLLERYPQVVDKSHTLKEYVEDDAEVLGHIAELEGLYTDLHMKQALGGQLSDSERARLLQLERSIPSFDVADPFGGSREQYRMTAKQIKDALDKLVRKIRSTSFDQK
ncbi:low molecular weight protein arginine phosphatase [Paenibacillaceae bacterium]|nr:low molecular weight protein arginine phosphatase [Paenibacillaceae bacterium]